MSTNKSSKLYIRNGEIFTTKSLEAVPKLTYNPFEAKHFVKISPKPARAVNTEAAKRT